MEIFDFSNPTHRDLDTTGNKDKDNYTSLTVSIDKETRKRLDHIQQVDYRSSLSNTISYLINYYYDNLKRTNYIGG